MFPLLWQYKDEVKTMAQAFFGGVHPNDMKAATNEKAIEQLAAPAEVVIPMSMHIGAPCKPIVAVGDKVKIVEFRPMSRNKRWHLVSIIEKAV